VQGCSEFANYISLYVKEMDSVELDCGLVHVIYVHLKTGGSHANSFWVLKLVKGDWLLLYNVYFKRLHNLLLYFRSNATSTSVLQLACCTRLSRLVSFKATSTYRRLKNEKMLICTLLGLHVYCYLFITYFIFAIRALKKIPSLSCHQDK